MPLAFIAIGALFLVAAIRGTVSDYAVDSNGKVTGSGNQPGLVTLLKSDFTGQNNFLVWLAAVWILGALGYVPGFKPLANALLALVVLVMIIANGNPSGGGGLFAKFQDALKAA